MRPSTPDSPRDEICADVNPQLWHFFLGRIGERLKPSNYTEAEVVQILDQMELASKAIESTLERLALFFTPTYPGNTRPH